MCVRAACTSAAQHVRFWSESCSAPHFTLYEGTLQLCRKELQVIKVSRLQI